MKALLLVGFVIGASAAGFGAQDPLGAAKELYGSAAYEEALALLARVDNNGPTELARQVDEYRAFCLYALGRTAEAESVAESLIRKDPMLRLDGGDVSPRIEAMFATIRKRLLPALIRDEYQLGRSARDKKNLAEAEPHLLTARHMLDEARTIGAWDDGLADLSLLVDGFLDLAHAAAVQQPQIALRSEAAPEPGRVETSTPVAPTPTRVADLSAGTTDGSRVYDSSDTDVSPPIAIRQAVPAPPPQLLNIMRTNQQRGGLVEVVIDETGAVQDAVMRQSVNAGYDNVILGAARTWRYRPATKAGISVRYRKAIVISLKYPD